MSSPVARCLAILRLLKVQNATDNLRAVLLAWGVDHTDMAQVARVRCKLIEEVDQAEIVISGMNLEADARDGLLETTAALKNFLSAPMDAQIQAHFHAISAAVGGMAILVSAAALTAPPVPTEVDELKVALEEALDAFGQADLDQRVRETAVRHLQVLKLLLTHFEAFGVDAAMLAYAELIVRLNKAMQAPAKPEQKEAARGLFDRLVKLGDKLKKINEVYDQAGTALEHAGEIAGALGFAPEAGEP